MRMQAGRQGEPQGRFLQYRRTTTAAIGRVS
jgi:hypothetical protein